MASTTKILLNKFIKYDQMIKRKEGEVDKLKEELAPIHDELLQRFQNEGTASHKTASGTTVYINRQLWAGSSDAGPEVMMEALKSNPDTSDLVKEKVNTQTLSSWVREKIEEYFGEEAKKKSEHELLEALPASLRPVLKITEKFQLKARRS